MANKIYTEADIKEIYQQEIKKPATYFQQHKKLSETVAKILPGWDCKTKDYPRLACVYDFNQWLDKYELRKVGKMLATCVNDPEVKLVQAIATTYAVYDGKNNDLHNIDLPEKDYDLIIVSQTLEHVYDTQLVMRNLLKHLRPGGYLFTSVPMLNFPHCMPTYYGGINPLGLSMLARITGWEVKEIGYWGSHTYIEQMFKKKDWPTAATMGDVDNEEFYVCQCWGLFQKPVT